MVAAERDAHDALFAFRVAEKRELFLYSCPLDILDLLQEALGKYLYEDAAGRAPKHFICDEWCLLLAEDYAETHGLNPGESVQQMAEWLKKDANGFV